MEYQYPSYNGFRCIACNIAFNTFDDQKQHYYVYHSKIVNPVPSNPPTYSIYKAHKPKPQPVNCEVCKILCSSRVVFEGHISGKKHIKALEKLNQMVQSNKQINNSVSNINDTNGKNVLMSAITKVSQSKILTADIICTECNVNCSNLDQMKLHLSGAKHVKAMKMKNFAELKSKKDPSVYCEACDIFLLDDLMKLHREGGKHKRKCSETSPIEPAGKKRKIAASLTTVEHCGYCLLDFKSSSAAVEHYQSTKHAIISGKNRKPCQFWCEDCQMSLDSQNMLDFHLKGYKHYVKVNRGNANPEGEMAAKLLKMREKMKGLKAKKTEQKTKSDESTTKESETVESEDTSVVD